MIETFFGKLVKGSWSAHTNVRQIRHEDKIFSTHKERHLIKIKVSIYQEDIAIIHICTYQSPKIYNA